MFWGCYAASGTGRLECVHGIMKSGDYQGILERNVQSSVRKLGLCRRSWVFEQENDKFLPLYNMVKGTSHPHLL